jgi:hypothetical protein
VLVVLVPAGAVTFTSTIPTVLEAEATAVMEVSLFTVTTPT